MLTSIWKIFIAREIDDKEEPEIVHEGLYASVSTMQVMLSHYCRKRNCGKDIRATFHRVVPPLGNATKIEQVITYAGSTANGIGREFSINTGITGQAIRRRKPITMSSTVGTEANHRGELVADWGYTETQEQPLTKGGFSEEAFPELDTPDKQELGEFNLTQIKNPLNTTNKE